MEWIFIFFGIAIVFMIFFILYLFIELKDDINEANSRIDKIYDMMMNYFEKKK